MFENEKVVEIKACNQCNDKFEVTDKDLEFYEKISPVFKIPPSLPLSGEEQAIHPDKGEKGGYKYLIPPPTLCPDCRQQRRLSFRNERNLYHRNCDLCQNNIISIYSPMSKYPIYCPDCWWSDKWSAQDFGKDFDFSQTFFQQFGELMSQIPRLSIVSLNSENSQYSSQGTNNKNCYMCFTTSYSEDCLYSSFAQKTTKAVDCLNCVGGNVNYGGVNISDCNTTFFCVGCKNCSFSYFLKNCEGCSDCFGCSNLKNAKYYIYNTQYTEIEYKKKLEQVLGEKNILNKNNYQNLPHRALNNINSENVLGDELFDSYNSLYCFNGFYIENCKYCSDIGDLKDSMDCNSFGHNCSLSCECISGEQDYNTLFGSMILDGKFLLYCESCRYCSFLFGCVGLKHKSYCILNKQCSKEEYENLVPKIIEHMMKTGEWGEFFPSSISPFGYNETVANEYFPLSRENVIPAKAGIYKNEKIPLNDSVINTEGQKEKEIFSSPDSFSESGLKTGKIFNWSDYEAPFPKVEKIIPANKLPENISQIPDDILNWAIECEVTKKPFKIIKEELDFYRKHNLPIPKRHPDQRHLDRMALRNPRKLFERKCDKCGKDMQTTYEPERPEIVYCAECYNKEVY